MMWTTTEGETPLSPDDRSGLLDPAIRTRDQLTDAEFRNNNSAGLKYLARRPSRKRAPFTYGWCLDLHREMFGDVWDWAGTIRSRELNIGVSPAIIGQRLAELVADLEYWRANSGDVLEQAVCLHHRAVLIHPFANGNGRWSRLLANIWLRQNGHPLVRWPTVVSEAGDLRSEYIACLKLSDAGDIQLLFQLHNRLLERQ